MPTTKKTTANDANGTAAAPSPAYLRLVKQFRLRPLRTEEDHRQAVAQLDALLSRKALLHPEEEEYLDVLSDLVEHYEEEAVPMPDVSAAEMLRFLLEQRGITQQALARETGIANSTISAVLTGTRQLTRRHIEKFAVYFGVEPAVFLPGNE